ncbi:MAG: hypothetical protein ABWY02_01140 [Telluria sp.]
MRLILLTGALACAAACAHSTAAPLAAGWTVYTDVSVWQASDAVPISQIEDEWTAYSPRNGRNTALMRNRVAAGVEKNGWRLGLELRQDAWLATDRASLDAYHMYQQKRNPVPPASLALQGRYFSWQAQGLRIGYTVEGPRIAGRASSIEMSGAAYGRQRLRERSFGGTLNYPQADTYGFAASHIDANSRMIYPFMGEAPRASGAGLSLAATVPLAEAWTLRVQADDVASRLRWKNLPVNTESLRSDVRSYDENGYVNYQPLLSGRKRQLERSFRIPRYTAAALDYRFQAWGAGVQVARYGGETIPTLSVSRGFGWLTVQANVETRFDSAGLGLEAGNFRFLLQSDSFRLDEAKARSLQLHYHVNF